MKRLLTEENFLTDSLSKIDLVKIYENQINELQAKIKDDAIVLNNLKEINVKTERQSQILIDSLDQEIYYYKKEQCDLNSNINQMELTIVKLVEKNEELQFDLLNFDFSKVQCNHIENKTSILREDADNTVICDQSSMIDDLKHKCNYYEQSISTYKEDLLKSEEEKMEYKDEVRR